MACGNAHREVSYRALTSSIPVPSKFRPTRKLGSTGSAATGEASRVGRGPRPNSKPQDCSSETLGGPALSTVRSRNGTPCYHNVPTQWVSCAKGSAAVDSN